MIFEGTKNQFFFGLGLTRAGKALRSITEQRILQFLRSSVVMMWSLDASCKDITAIFRSFILIRRQVPKRVLQK